MGAPTNEAPLTPLSEGLRVSPRPRTRRLLLASAAALAVATTGAVGSAGGASAAEPVALPGLQSPSASLTAGNYIVMLKDDAAAAYDGGVAGYAATRPVAGQHYDATSTAARSYIRYLDRKQDAAIDSVDAKAYYRYTSGLNGFAAHLSAAQASKLAADKSVLKVEKAEDQELTATPISGVPANGWANGYDAANIPDRNFAGRGVVIGVIDSGIWPESASFAGRSLGRAKGTTPWIDGYYRSGEDAPPAEGPTTSFLKSDGTYFHGLCQLGEGWTAADCNQKLISAQYFDSGFLRTPVAERSPDEYLSTRDGDGHGTHTASIAGGNLVKHAVIGGHDFGAISGTAPEAKIAAYKVCFSDTDEATGDCSTADSVAAIDQAVADGVDVINYSISGSQDTVVDAVEVAFLNAALGGIFVAASAGNDGTTASVAHPSPWLTTVAASNDARHEGTVVLGNGASYKGASNNYTPVPSAPLVLSTAIGLPAATADDVRLCGPGTLDPAGAAGKIVVCDRGVFDRVAKSAEVERAGGVGMVLANTAPNSLDADLHSVPTVHVDEVAGAAIKAYIASTASPTAAIELGDTTGGAPTPIPQLAGFSSRGPSQSAGGGILKPDITGPGVSYFASVSPPTNSGRSFDAYSGTSMSSPYVAGLAALYFSVHAKWTPSMVKSAMMTTAYDLKNVDGTVNADPLQEGAGHVDPQRMLQPGLVVESTPLEWLEFLVGQGFPLGDLPALAPEDLNSPSIASGSVVNSITVTRTFTALLQGTYKVDVDVPGFTTDAPSTLKFTYPGQKKSLTVTFTRDSAPLGAYATGFLTLSGPRTVRLPVALQPIALSAPAEVAGSGASGSVDVTFRAGETGAETITTAGLAAGAVSTGTLHTGDQAGSVVVIPAGATFARFDLDAADDTADLDLYLYPVVDGKLGPNYVALSATGSADEQINLVDPTPGTYVALVDGYATPPGADTVDFTETNYVVTPDTTLGNLTVTPNPVPTVAGEPATFTVSWSGLDPSTPYLGWLGYSGSDATTILTVN